MASPQPLALRRSHHQLLEHVARDRLTVHAVLRRRGFAGQSPAAAAKVTRRLCHWGLLRRFSLPAGRSYFVLTAAAARRLGVSVKRASVLGPQALPTELGVLLYVHLTRQPRLRLTPEELRTQYPWLKPAWCTAPHCLDLSVADAPCLELMRVDLGGQAQHVARKCQRDVRRRLELAPFIELVRQSRFRLVVVTATAEKSRAIRQSIDGHLWPPGLEIRLVVLPQLLSLLGSAPHAP